MAKLECLFGGCSMFFLNIGKIKHSYFYLIGVSVLASTVFISLQSKAEDLPIGKKTQPMTSGTRVPIGELEAIGQVNSGSCSGTLVDNNLVLTAAHCFCTVNAPACNQRATFTLTDVFPVDNPNTPIDESRTRRNITITGTVRVHPNFPVPLRDTRVHRFDIATIRLDRPVSSVALNVRPIAVEQPYNTAILGDQLTLVGYGLTGTPVQQPNGTWECTPPSGVKFKITLAAQRATGSERIDFSDQNRFLCGGDSGGGVLNTAQRVVGVNTGSDRQRGDSVVTPTSTYYNWIFGIPQPGSTSSRWVKIGNSHSPGGSAWCPNGSFIDAIDLDADNRISAHDSPVIGQVRCSKLSGAESNGWAASEWFKVEQRGINSHAQRPAWCPNGGYITQIDLDQDARISADDSPVIGQVRCASLGGYRRWGSSYWVEIGQLRSHNPGASWCENGGFITQIDLDQSAASAHDDPIVGRAKCSHPIP